MLRIVIFQGLMYQSRSVVSVCEAKFVTEQQKLPFFEAINLCTKIMFIVSITKDDGGGLEVKSNSDAACVVVWP